VLELKTVAQKAGTGDTNTLKMVAELVGSPHVSAEGEPVPGRQQSLLGGKINQTVHKASTFDSNQAG